MLLGGGVEISIHAPRTGSDVPCWIHPQQQHDFNPRSPHGERLEPYSANAKRIQFQSTLPARGATTEVAPIVNKIIDFNPRSPHGERHCETTSRFAHGYFNPRSPHGERLRNVRGKQSAGRISIHAPRTGSDQCVWRNDGELQDFNPRSPHGERLRKVTILSIRIIGFAQKVYHKTVLLRISLAENAVILPEKPRNPVRTSLQKAGGLRFARAIRAARPYSISSPSGA